MSNFTMMPNYLLREWHAIGKPLSGGTLSFYQSGTFTPKAVYADAQGSVSLGSVVTLDASGSAVIFMGRGAYRIWLKDSNGVQVVPYVDGIVGSGAGIDVQSNMTLALVEKYDDLRQLTGDIDIVYVAGRSAEGDGGAGIFQYVPADTSTDNDGTILVTALSQRVYKRVFDGYLDPRWWGVEYGSTDSYYPLTFALAASAALNFPLLISDAVYISQNLTVPNGANVEFTDGAFLHTGSSQLTATFEVGSHLSAVSRIFGTNVYPKIGKGVCKELPISWMAGQVDDDRLDKLWLASTDPTQIVVIDEDISVLATTWICPNQLRFTNEAVITFTGTSALDLTAEYIQAIPFKTFAITDTTNYVFNFGAVPAYPEMFGAKADGSTDDTVAFKYASTNKKIILVEGKTYLVNDNISASEVNIEGAGIILLGTTSTLTIDTFSLDSVTIALQTRNNTGSSATIEHSDTSGNATLVSPGFPFGVKAGTHISVPGFTGGNWTTTADSDHLTIVTGLGWGTADYFAGGVATVTSAPDSTDSYLIANVFYAKDSAFPSYYTATTELFEGCTFTDLARTMVHNPPNLYNASLPLIRNASSLGTDPTGLIVGVGMEGANNYVEGVDYTFNMGNNTWGTVVDGTSLQIIDITPHMLILTWSMTMLGGVPPQSPTNLFAYVEFTAISTRLKTKLGLTPTKYGANKLLNGMVNKIGTITINGYTNYTVKFPDLMGCGFGSGYVISFVFYGAGGTEGQFSQSGYTPNPWLGWGNIFTNGPSYASTVRHYLGGSGLLINEKPFS